MTLDLGHRTSVCAIVPGAGLGTRFIASVDPGTRRAVPKALQLVGPKTVLEWTVAALFKSPLIQLAVILLPEDVLSNRSFNSVRKRLSAFPVQIATGGPTGHASRMAGLRLAVQTEASHFLFQDAVRPCVSESSIYQSVSAAGVSGAAAASLPFSRTMAQIAPASVLPRENFAVVIAPQTVSRRPADLLLSAQSAFHDGDVDIFSSLNCLSEACRLYDSPDPDIKITEAFDLIMFESWLRSRHLLRKSPCLFGR